MVFTSFLHGKKKKTLDNIGELQSDAEENLTEFSQISLQSLSYLTNFSLQLMACMEIVEEMKERDREERGTGMKVKKQKKQENR